MLMVVVVAHCPTAGVKVYTVVPAVEVLTVAGFHVPVIAGVFVELVGNTGAVPFWQILATGAKVGVISLSTVTLSVAVAAH